MVKLKPLPQRKVIEVLEKNGFKNVRTRKHMTFKKRLENGKVLTTWVPLHKEISKFVLKYIVKQTRKSIEEFL